MRKRILIIGPEGSGKKELIRVLENEEEICLIKSIVYGRETIYVPSTYLRSPSMKKHIIATQQNAYCLLMLLHSSRAYRVYSPNFAQVFRLPSLGIIAHHSGQSIKNTADCIAELREAGVDEIIEWEMENSDTYHELCKKIEQLKEGNQ
ncbi:EutP/PduV family microcompartment system protein [Streptococcus sp. S784/96/1]|uniref:EutP/PduV family microcompartment system protein n=1 Tax=Streptococcus sp. S784/96/1 TaxID=2653499 RepID=UPI001386C25C|nr:EutP/PduV family microcompartment system protein [Streptococcus sp. S784/96/1]